MEEPNEQNEQNEPIESIKIKARRMRKELPTKQTPSLAQVPVATFNHLPPEKKSEVLNAAVEWHDVAGLEHACNRCEMTLEQRLTAVQHATDTGQPALARAIRSNNNPKAWERAREEEAEASQRAKDEALSPSRGPGA